MGAALFDRNLQRFTRREQVFLAEEILERIRAHAIGKRAIQIIAHRCLCFLMCKQISQVAS